MSTPPIEEGGSVVEGLVAAKLVERIRGGNEVLVVTGATGWLGTVTLHILGEALGADADRRLRAFAATGRVVRLRSGRTVDVRPLAELTRLKDPGAPLCVLHFAYLMRHRSELLGRAEFVRQNRAISEVVLEAVARLRPTSFCFASSGAVYDGSGGFVDDLEHDPYATLKRADEIAFEEQCRRIGARCIVGRIYSVGGPFMPDRDRFVLGDLVDRARAGEPLRIRSRGELWRSYVGVGDVVSLFLAESLDGSAAFVQFDTGGAVVEAGELAEAVRRVIGHPGLEIERDLDPGVEPDRYVGDGRSFERLMAAHGLPVTPLDAQIRQVALA